MRCKEIEDWCENLRPEGYDQDPSKISPVTEEYNCIAFALGETKKPWWPSKRWKDDYEWPSHLDREERGQETLLNFICAFRTKGYRVCKTGKFRRGIEKVAIFANVDGNPLHAARQLETGVWKSKFGDYQDVEHFQVNSIEGVNYGKIAVYMRRRRDGKPFLGGQIWAFLRRLFFHQAVA